jgi:hypothetical protein
MKKIELIDLENALYTRKEVAKLLKIGVSSLDLLPETEISRVHIGKSVRFTPNSINAFIQRHETRPKRTSLQKTKEVKQC